MTYRRRRSAAGALNRTVSESRLEMPGSRFIAALLAASGGRQRHAPGQPGRKVAEYGNLTPACQFAVVHFGR
jgi:hypothetical protein